MNEYRLIPLLDIDSLCDDFRFSFSLADSVLENSVAKFGVMQPVVVLPVGNSGRYRVVSGFKRLHAFSKTGGKSLPCSVLSHIPCVDVWLYIANDNLFRELSEVEKGSLIAKAFSDSGQNAEWVILNLFPVLGLEKSRKILEEYLLVHSLTRDILKISHDKSYPLRFLVFLSGFSFEEQGLVAELLSCIPCGYNKVSSLLAWLYDITIRYDVSLSSVLEMREMRDIIASDLSPSKKGERVRNFVRSLRFPALSTAERSFLQKGKTLCLEKNVSFFPPKHMEGKEVEFRVFARSSAELLRGANSLLAVSQKFDIGSYFFGKKSDD